MPVTPTARLPETARRGAGHRGGVPRCAPGHLIARRVGGTGGRNRWTRHPTVQPGIQGPLCANWAWSTCPLDRTLAPMDHIGRGPIARDWHAAGSAASLAACLGEVDVDTLEPMASEDRRRWCRPRRSDAVRVALVGLDLARGAVARRRPTRCDRTGCGFAARRRAGGGDSVGADSRRASPEHGQLQTSEDESAGSDRQTDPPVERRVDAERAVQ